MSGKMNKFLFLSFVLFFLIGCSGIENEEVSCEDFSDFAKYICYANTGKSRLDSNFCEKVAGEDSISISARRDCFNYVAKHTSNPEICESIEDQEEINRCITNIALDNIDLTICDNVKNYNLEYKSNNDAKGGCYVDVLFNEKDPSLCEQENIDSDLCYYKLSFILSDPNYCELAGNLSSKC